MANRFLLDTERLLDLHRAEGLAVVLEHEDLMATPQYERLKPWVQVDLVRATGQFMLVVIDESGFTWHEVWHLLAHEVRFSRPPQVRVGRVRFPCGKEVPGA